MLSPEFLLASFIVVLVPGTGVIYTISTGLFRGWQASIAAALGCTLGIVPHLLASVFGLAALLHVSALAFQAVKFAWVAYLFYLAWGMWQENGAIAFEKSEQKKGRAQTLIRGFLLNILNPKLSIFFLAFMPQFVEASAASPMPQMVGLSGVFMLMTLVVFILYGFCAHGVRSHVASSPGLVRRLQRVFAAGFAALGLKLALTDQ